MRPIDVSKSRKYLAAHLAHFSKFMLPCNSARQSGFIPLRRCKPSQFCETKHFKIPRRCNSTRALGEHRSMMFVTRTSILHVRRRWNGFVHIVNHGGFLWSWCFITTDGTRTINQTKCRLNEQFTLVIPKLQVLSVGQYPFHCENQEFQSMWKHQRLIERWKLEWRNFDYSPVKTMKCLLSLIHWANWSSFWSRSCWGSKCSFFMSGSERPWAIGEASDRRQVTINTECAEPTRVTRLYRFVDLVAHWCNYVACVKTST